MGNVLRAATMLLLGMGSACANMARPVVLAAPAGDVGTRGAAPMTRPAIGGGPLSDPSIDPGLNAPSPTTTGAPRTLKRPAPNQGETIPPTI